MSWLFDKQTGLSVYGASILLGIVIIIGAIAGVASEAKSGIEPRANSDYRYSEDLPDYNAALVLFPSKCLPCHKLDNKGPGFPGDGGWDAFDKVKGKNICSGYVMKPGRCFICHAEENVELIEMDTDEGRFEEVRKSPDEHEEIESFSTYDISEDDMTGIMLIKTFKPRWSDSEWLAIIITLASIIGLAIYLLWIVFHKKDERWLT